MGTRKALFGLGLGSQHSKEIPEVHVVLLGELGVGKSALTVKYITRRFIIEYDPTLEDTYSKAETLDGQDVCVKIMDTYDQEGENSDRYMKWAHGYIIVYSITDHSSFDKARAYLNSITAFFKHKGREPPVALVGNKVDLERYRTVSRTSGERLAGEFDCSFHESSAAEDLKSVEKVFHAVIRDITRDNQMALQPLIISEDKSAVLNSAGQATARNNLRRVKSPKGSDIPGGINKKDDDKDSGAKSISRRPGVGLRLFKVNKSFKIFS